jgi:biopolymer transport protein ExbD
MNYSATGEVFFINRDIKIPNAFHGVAMSSKPLISITENFVMLDAEKVGDNPLHIEEKDKELPKLRLALQKMKRFHDQAHPGVPFEGGVNIQADQATPVIYIKRVMNTLLMEGWTAINFVVRQPDQQKVAAHD